MGCCPLLPRNHHRLIATWFRPPRRCVFVFIATCWDCGAAIMLLSHSSPNCPYCPSLIPHALIPLPIRHRLACCQLRHHTLTLSLSLSLSLSHPTVFFTETLTAVNPVMASRELFRRATSVLHRPMEPRVALASVQQAKRGFAQERPQDSSTSNWGAGEPPIDEKNTERGVPPKSDAEGQVPTPSLNRQKSTRDFINTKREEKLNAAKTSKRPSGVDSGGVKLQENVKDQ